MKAYSGYLIVAAVRLKQGVFNMCLGQEAIEGCS